VASVITCIPACKSPPVISVRRPSLEPTVTNTGRGVPFASTQTLFSPFPPLPLAFLAG
jgi:hypothetical protein